MKHLYNQNTISLTYIYEGMKKCVKVHVHRVEGKQKEGSIINSYIPNLHSVVVVRIDAYKYRQQTANRRREKKHRTQHYKSSI